MKLSEFKVGDMVTNKVMGLDRFVTIVFMGRGYIVYQWIDGGETVEPREYEKDYWVLYTPTKEYDLMAPALIIQTLMKSPEISSYRVTDKLYTSLEHAKNDDNEFRRVVLWPAIIDPATGMYKVPSK